MKLVTSTHLSKLNALLAFVSLIIFIVAFATNFWLQRDFDFPVKVSTIDTIPVEASIGLFTACSVEHYPNNRSHSNCSPDGAAEWQFISAGLCVVELVLTVIGLIVVCLAVFVPKLANNLRVKLAIAVCWFVTCSFSVGPLLMFAMNKTIQVRPNINEYRVDFDLSWSYDLAATSSAIFAVLVLLNITDLLWSRNSASGNKKGDTYVLALDRNNVSW